MRPGGYPHFVPLFASWLVAYSVLLLMRPDRPPASESERRHDVSARQAGWKMRASRCTDARRRFYDVQRFGNMQRDLHICKLRAVAFFWCVQTGDGQAAYLAAYLAASDRTRVCPDTLVNIQHVPLETKHVAGFLAGAQLARSGGREPGSGGGRYS